MPNKYKPLTEEEKKEIQRRYIEYVDKINAYFAANNRPQLDKYKGMKDLKASFNDEEKVAKYRLSSDMKKKEEKQTEIMKRLDEKYKGIAVHDEKNYLARGIKFMLKTDGSKESEKYNDDLVRTYYKNPEDFTHNTLKSLINYNPKELIEAGNDEIKQMEFASNNYALCAFSNEFIDISRMQGLNVPSDVKNSLECTKGLMEHVGQAKKNAARYDDLDYFAFPKLNEEQRMEVLHNSRQIFGGPLTDGQKRELMPSPKGIKSFADYAKGLEDVGFDFNQEHPFTRFKAVQTNPETLEEKEVSLYDAINKKENVTLQARTDEEVEKINNNITGQYKLKYNFEFQKRLGKNNGKPYNIFKTEKEMKGNLWDRWFHRPSTRFKGFMKALKNYSDPKNGNYLDKKNLLRWAYMSNYEIGGKKYEPTSEIERQRMEFVDNTIKTIRDMERDEAQINEQINKDIASVSVKDPDSIKREPAFGDDKALEELLGKENLKEGIDLNKAFIAEKEDEVEASNDNQEMQM